MSEQVWWFVARSSGLVAWGLVTLSVCWGLMLSTRAVSKVVSSPWVLDVHRFAGGLSVVFTGLHVLGLVADSYVSFGWAEVLVPFASEWRPGPVAAGVVGMYVLVAVEVTSLMMSRMPRRWWLRVHRLSFVLFVLATYHALAAGADAGNGVFRLVALASVNVVMFLTVVSVLAARKSRLAKLP